VKENDAMVEETGTELTLTAPADQSLERRRSKPTLVQIGNRTLTSDGRFHADLCAEFCLVNARKNWVKVADLSKVFCGRNCLDGKKTVRKNLFRVFTQLLAHGEFLVYETVGPRGRINAVKLLDVCSEQERQAARPQIERMRRNHQLSTEKYEKAIQVIELKQNLFQTA
jgi:hypothetical protein